MSLREEIAKEVQEHVRACHGAAYYPGDCFIAQRLVNKVLDAVIALGEDHEYDKSTYFYMEAINKLRQEK